MKQKSSKDKDQFYTKPAIAKWCLGQLKETIDISVYELLVEPSAGNGAFYNLLPKKKRIGLDIDPKVSEILNINYFDWVPLVGVKTGVIGNPPFGKNSNLAVKFFNKSAEYAEFIAFVLPKTFRKASLINRLNENFHLIKDCELPKNSFIFEDSPYDVPCCFQIWVKSSKPRQKIKIINQHDDFKIVSKTSYFDFAIQRVGGRAGLFRDRNEAIHYSDQSHYFIKSNIPLDEIITIFKSIDFSEVKFNTAGNPSISPGELYSLYQKYKELLNHLDKVND